MSTHQTPGGERGLIGKSGEFTMYNGKVCQCVVKGIEPDPFDYDPIDLLVIDYIHPTAGKIKNAMIAIRDFRPDPTPNP